MATRTGRISKKPRRFKEEEIRPSKARKAEQNEWKERTMTFVRTSLQKAIKGKLVKSVVKSVGVNARVKLDLKLLKLF